MWVCACVCVCICWTFVHSLYSSICFIRMSIFTAMTAEIKKVNMTKVYLLTPRTHISFLRRIQGNIGKTAEKIVPVFTIIQVRHFIFPNGINHWPAMWLCNDQPADFSILVETNSRQVMAAFSVLRTRVFVVLFPKHDHDSIFW